MRPEVTVVAMVTQVTVMVALTALTTFALTKTFVFRERNVSQATDAGMSLTITMTFCH